MSSLRSPLLGNLIDQACWFFFLVWLLLASLASAPYDSVSWMLLSCLLYSASALYCVALLLGGRHNKKALNRNSLIIALAALSLLWLFIQTVLPVGNVLLQILNSSATHATWLLPGDQISIDPARTRWVMYSYFPAFVCMLLTCSMVNSRIRVKQILYLFIFVLLLHALVGIYVKYAGLYLVDKSQLDGHWSAARGWFVNRNHYAAFILTSMVGVLTFAIYRSQSEGKGLIKLLLMVSLIISFVAIVLSQSRAGLGCWVLVMLTAWFTSIYRTRRSGYGANKSKYSIGIRLVWAFIFIAVGLVFGTELWERLLHSPLSIGERGLQWQITFSAIKLSPWFGFGGGSYAQVFQYFRDYAELRQVVFDQSHNHYLQLLLEQGVVGLLLWLALLAMVGKRAISVIRKSKSRLIVSAAAAISLLLVAALVQSLVDFNLQIINLRCFFFVLIGLILALPTATCNQGTKK